MSRQSARSGRRPDLKNHRNFPQPWGILVVVSGEVYLSLHAWQWLNDGVAPLYEPCQVAIALLNENNQVIQKKWVPESHPEHWSPGVIHTEAVSATFTNVPFGKCKLAVGPRVGRIAQTQRICAPANAGLQIGDKHDRHRQPPSQPAGEQTLPQNMNL
jgi:hypothetical protein